MGIARLLRVFLALAGVAGVVLLVLATRATIIRIRLDASVSSGVSGVDTALSGADRHGVALIVIAVFAAMMLAGALRGAWPAAFALAAAGLIALGIAIVADARHIHDTGMVGRLYSEARAGAGGGFYLETLGGALLLMAGGGLALLGGAQDEEPRPVRERRSRRPRRERPTAAPSAAAGDAAPPARAADDWFTE